MKNILLAASVALLAACSQELPKTGPVAVEIVRDQQPVNGVCAYQKTDDAKFEAVLQQVSAGDKARKIYFFSENPRCAVALSAANRAQALGFTGAEGFGVPEERAAAIEKEPQLKNTAAKYTW